ncbi:hypothetical protein [Erythrobacter sp.]|uniref:hypothetical protein n=1 Tax=Erythrobacter sp. TaxID=1042 RepID=UPI0025F95313|nr:hypothetical protein [Erythrobacter sp.]
MKFILLESRGGNYLVVAENIAWLRTGENGQTNVGMVGGNPLLVVGSIEEVAAKILAATKQDEPPVAEASPAAAPELTPTPAAAPPVPAAAAPVPAPVAEPAAAPPAVEDQPVMDYASPAPVEEVAAENRAPKPAPERSRSGAAKPMTLADRLARAAPPKVKAGNQRLMTMSDNG